MAQALGVFVAFTVFFLVLLGLEIAAVRRRDKVLEKRLREKSYKE